MLSAQSAGKPRQESPHDKDSPPGYRPDRESTIQWSLSPYSAAAYVHRVPIRAPEQVLGKLRQLPRFRQGNFCCSPLEKAATLPYNRASLCACPAHQADQRPLQPRSRASIVEPPLNRALLSFAALCSEVPECRRAPHQAPSAAFASKSNWVQLLAPCLDDLVVHLL